MSDKYERISKLEEAQYKIQEAIDLIKEAVDGTDDERMAESYIIGHLSNWANGDNPYEKGTIPQLIENLSNYDEEYFEEEE